MQHVNLKGKYEELCKVANIKKKKVTAYNILL